jgi:hypothetical protein
LWEDESGENAHAAGLHAISILLEKQRLAAAVFLSDRAFPEAIQFPPIMEALCRRRA